MADDTPTEAPVEAPASETLAHHEEAVSETKHMVTVAGEQIPYVATAGRYLLRKEDGSKQASFFATSYVRTDIDDPSTRPVVFAFNGGPGSSSVWLHLGIFGPRRVELDDDGHASPPPGRLIDNDQTLLSDADMVFIDPVGTGFSRSIPDEKFKEFAHFRRDIESVGEFIHLWLSRHGRWGSPKYLAGESYGTTRAAGLAAHLHDRYGIYLNGLILISSVLNFGTASWDKNSWTFAVGNDLPYVVFLPTYAATAHYHGVLAEPYRSMPLRDFLDEVEGFAQGEYATALLAGDRLTTDDRQAIAAKIGGFTGLDPSYVARWNIRIEIMRFCKALLRDRTLTVGRLDSRYTGSGRFDDGERMETDPSGDELTGVFAAMFNAYVRGELAYQSDLPYEIVNMKVHEAWDYEEFKDANVDTSEPLRQAMARNRHLRVLVANGYFDLATPHFATEYTFSHMGLKPDARDRVRMTYYEAGHMMYVHAESRHSLARDIAEFLGSGSG